MSHLFLDQFDSARQAVFPKLAAFAPTFTLAGGTAIMLQIGHRQSYDFDCFCLEPLTDTIRKKMMTLFGKDTTIRFDTPDVFSVITPELVEVTLVSYPYPPLRPTIPTRSISLFHMDDLIASKAHTLGRRNAWRDYVDLFFVIKWNLYTIQSIITLAEQKYSNEFNARLFLGQLTYFDDIKIMETTFLKESYTPNEIQTVLSDAVQIYLKQIIPRS
ncbi:nucleotidyl transferase AbiEii/AbiGii toxin family protein [Patescibacteria group bacterium]|nr:nucleotidyl transferase AbiEii/AbiGii toxin family protein [Patescibacteria group bacterium]MBU1472607.1 nucleotidyl transferase AbiEii/AbiGii toxin family protein [Patescibacteria group bacterium]MBU2459858.1 nucleotidyl transferase AbiEii/AbiGii toxin family protein [Patescibacteria group bacterium]MBU2544081.1 nucleotidyl transferase AbiEii/AbiGii toxin family protein [Patescibacteria group bacterium]